MLLQCTIFFLMKLIQKIVMILLIYFLFCLTAIESMHFNGGTIRWEPVATYSNNVTSINIIQTYSWTYPAIKCSTDVPITTSGRSKQNVNLTCIADCSTDGGYASKQITILTDCQSSSSSLGLMTSQRSVNINLTTGAHFYLSFIGAAWAPISNPAQNGLQWTITTFIDLRIRPDGFINTPPTASVVSPQYAIVNRTINITIPVADVNSDDTVRCRWSTYTAGYRRRRSDEEDEDEPSTSHFYRSTTTTTRKKSFFEEIILSRMKRKSSSCSSCSSSCAKNCKCTCSGCSGTACSGNKCSTNGGCPAVTTTAETPGTVKSTISYANRQAIDECGGICYPNGLPTGTTLSSSDCTISFTGLVPDTWYAVALQVRIDLLFTNNKINLIC